MLAGSFLRQQRAPVAAWIFVPDGVFVKMSLSGL